MAEDYIVKDISTYLKSLKDFDAKYREGNKAISANNAPGYGWQETSGQIHRLLPQGPMWDIPSHQADTLGGLARYGMPEGVWKDESGNDAPAFGGIFNLLMKSLFQKQVEKQYPDYDWRKAPRPTMARENQKDLPPPYSQEYKDYLRSER